MLTVITRSYPPQVCGSAIMMANLLGPYAGPVKVVAGHTKYAKSDAAFRSPCPVRSLRIPRLASSIYDPLATRFPEAMWRLLLGPMQGSLAQGVGGVVLSVFPADEFLVSSVLAARSRGLPSYVYMHDLWLENMPRGTARYAFARKWEPRILGWAKRVLCTTEAMQEHYRRRYGLSTDLLPHVIPDRDLLGAPRALRQVGDGARKTVLFVGGVSSYFNQDALRVLAAASELLPPEYDLEFLTANDRASLDRADIRSSRLRVSFVSREEAQRRQREATVLVAPLSHKNGTSEEVRTVFSTKLLEYLVSGRPILVFAPEGSFHAVSARDRWGLVITDDTPRALADGIVRLATDEPLARGLVAGALAEAHRRSAGLHAERLRDWVVRDG